MRDISDLVEEGWKMAQGIGYTWPEITDAFRNENQIRQAIWIGVKIGLEAAREETDR